MGRRKTALFFYIQIGLEVFYIFFEGGDAGGSDLANGLGVVVLKGFGDIDVAGLFQLIDLDAEIAGRGARLFPEIGKFRLFDRDQDADDGQSQLRMQYRVEVFKHVVFLLSDSVFSG